jgi:hypothetical protein
MDFSEAEYNKNFQLEADIGIGQIEGQDAGSIPTTYTTSYISSTALGTNNEQARFTGEFENSEITVASTDISARNRFKLTSDQTLSTDRFQSSDYNTLGNNVQQSRTSTFRKDSANIQKASVQDSNYTDTGLSNARYNGSVKSPTFNPSGSDLFNSEQGDYPILRFEVAEGLLFELSTNAKVIEDIRKNPVRVDQLNLEKVYYTTVVRDTSAVGFRQVESSGSLIQSETFFDNQSPKFQTFVYREVGKSFEKIASKQLLFLQQTGIQ